MMQALVLKVRASRSDPRRRQSPSERRRIMPRGDRPSEGRAMSDLKRQIMANVSRLHAYMDHHRLAAVAARSGQNFTYLSGLAYPGTLARHLDLPDSMRGVLLVC